MSCVLTTGFALDCKDTVGGINKIWVISSSNKGTFTKSASGTVTTWTPVANSLFKYELRKASSSFETDIMPNQVNGTTYYETKLSIKLGKMEVYKRNELTLLAQQLLIFIVLDRNGTYWVIGDANGSDMTTGKGSTGVAMGDFNGWELEFTAQEPQMPAILDSAVVTSLGLS